MTAEDLRPEREAAFSEQCLGMTSAADGVFIAELKVFGSFVLLSRLAALGSGIED
jgi:hypothetical protein